MGMNFVYLAPDAEPKFRDMPSWARRHEYRRYFYVMWKSSLSQRCAIAQAQEYRDDRARLARFVKLAFATDIEYRASGDFDRDEYARRWQSEEEA